MKEWTQVNQEVALAELKDIKKIFIIGLGHRARQGKDTVANMIAELRPNTHILHFADALYEEVINKERRYPLITRIPLKYSDDVNVLGFDWIYAILNDAKTGRYLIFKDTDVPYLHTIFTERDITTYWGMHDKDAPMLQFWGTDFRRKQNPHYWVDKVRKKIIHLNDIYNEELWIIIPDVRFKNEVNFIGKSGGYYIRIIRTDENGNQYIDSSRDPNHSSEIDIVGVMPYETISAKSGELDWLKHQTKVLLERIERENYGKK